MVSLNGLLGRGNKPGLEDLDVLHNQCLREIEANTPKGWDAKVVNGEHIKPYCYAETSLEGRLDTIPAIPGGWRHAGYDTNGFFGYIPYGRGHIPETAGSKGSRPGAEIAMRHEKGGRTSITVMSHPSYYKEAVALAQSITDQARSGYLRVTKAPAVQP